MAELGDKLDYFTSKNGNIGRYENVAGQIDSHKRNLHRFTNMTRMSKFSETPSLRKTELPGVTESSMHYTTMNATLDTTAQKTH